MSRTNRLKIYNRDFRQRKEYFLENILIVTDTAETEYNYLTGIKNRLPENLKKKIKIIPNVKTADLVVKCIEMMSKSNYSIGWIVFDRDKVSNFDDIIERAHKKGINVGWSNPCIEVWFYGYFDDVPSIIDSKKCLNKFNDKFMQIIKLEYDKTDKNIYDKLNKYGDENAAIVRAENRIKTFIKSEKTESEMFGCTRIYELIKKISLNRMH